MELDNPIEPIPQRLQRIEDKLDLLLSRVPEPVNYATMETVEQQRQRHVHPVPHDPGYPPGHSDAV
jgi:NifB/MoaA-like Fe-S oxidoreductase